MVKALSLLAPVFCGSLGQGVPGVGGAGKLTQAGVSCRTGLLGRGQMQTDAKYGIQPPQPSCSRGRLQTPGTLCTIWNTSGVFFSGVELQRLLMRGICNPLEGLGVVRGGTIRGCSTSEEQNPRGLSSEPGSGLQQMGQDLGRGSEMALGRVPWKLVLYRCCMEQSFTLDPCAFLLGRSS